MPGQYELQAMSETIKKQSRLDGVAATAKEEKARIERSSLKLRIELCNARGDENRLGSTEGRCGRCWRRRFRTLALQAESSTLVNNKHSRKVRFQCLLSLFVSDLLCIVHSRASCLAQFIKQPATKHDSYAPKTSHTVAVLEIRSQR